MVLAASCGLLFDKVLLSYKVSHMQLHLCLCQSSVACPVRVGPYFWVRPGCGGHAAGQRGCQICQRSFSGPNGAQIRARGSAVPAAACQQVPAHATGWLARSLVTVVIARLPVHCCVSKCADQQRQCCRHADWVVPMDRVWYGQERSLDSKEDMIIADHLVSLQPGIGEAYAYATSQASSLCQF